MIDRIAYLFGQTAWPMEMQAPGSAFHLLLSLAGIACAVLAAMFLADRKNLRPENVLFSCGLLLAFFELYKQGFLYFVVNGRCYNWWYFPFQLCSIPMYLCLAYPFVAGPILLPGNTAFLTPEVPAPQPPFWPPFCRISAS